MAFDKEAYRKNRDEHKRGQGEKEKLGFTPTVGLGGGRKAYRAKVRKRFYEPLMTKLLHLRGGKKRYEIKEDTVGKVYTAKGVKHKKGEKKNVW